MLFEVNLRIRDAIRSAIQIRFGIEAPDVILNQTPKVELGEFATPVCFDLAKRLKKAPRAVAEELIQAVGSIPGVRKTELAGAGYVNFFLDRGTVFRAAFQELAGGPFKGLAGDTGKTIVEHTNINPNKAAHIGHLRNAVIGDTFVRILRACGREVEVQNYIDNTGVQVGDAIVGFKYLEKKSVDDVRDLIEDPGTRFDYYCWDLYARVGAYYEIEDPKHVLRGKTLQEIEESGNETARMAELVAMKIVQCHLATMARINVQYDLLPRESDILHLKFWERAFKQLREANAIVLESEGKNSGCWVMRIDSEGYDDDKIIVRSNGTVTYVGKDIAYQLWKLGLLNQDFYYRRLDGDRGVWITTSTPTPEGSKHPDFGHGKAVYNVIDVRQSYLQNVVRQGVRALGYEEQVRNSFHFHYEVVALTPACAEQLGIVLSEEDRKKSHIEVSGRKGHGVKADDLLDRLEFEARKQVAERNTQLSEPEIDEIAHQIAVGALRHFLLKFTRTAIIAFDFREALNFDGETGPYLQYATVRANAIMRKVLESDSTLGIDRITGFVNSPEFDALIATSDDIWEVAYTASRLDEISNQVVTAMEPATLAKYAFVLAQRFSLFYHRYRIVSEEDPQKRLFYLAVVELARRALTRTLDMMGIETPARM